MYIRTFKGHNVTHSLIFYMSVQFGLVSCIYYLLTKGHQLIFFTCCLFKAYEKKEQVSLDPRFQTQKLMVLIGLLYCHLTGNDLMTCVSLLHQ